MKSTLTCLTYGNVSIKFDPLMYLSLPLASIDKDGDEINLQSCLHEFTTAETLTDDERWYCSKCKKFRDATKKIDLWKLPPVLIIHLKRFKYDRYGSRVKLENFVDFPVHDLDLRNFVKSPQRDNPIYNLFATSNHHGGYGGGHYTATGYSPKKRKVGFTLL